MQLSRHCCGNSRSTGGSHQQGFRLMSGTSQVSCEFNKAELKSVSKRRTHH